VNPWRRFSKELLLAAMFHPMLGCGGRYSVDPGDDVLVVTRHERTTSAITETISRNLAYEVTTSDDRGTFTFADRPRLSIPMLAEVETTVTLSRPGFAVFHGSVEGPNANGPGASVDGQGRFTLQPTTSYREERLSLWLMLRGIDGVCDRVSSAECALIDEHTAARRAYLLERYPEQTAAAERAATSAPFHILSPSWRTQPGGAIRLMAVSALPGGGLAAVHQKSGRGRELVFLSADMAAFRRIPLQDPGTIAAMSLGPDGVLSVYDAGAILRFDATGTQLERLVLEDDPGLPVTAMASVPQGLLLAVEHWVGAGPDTNQLRLYALDGSLLEAQDLPDEVQRLLRVGAAPDGALVVHCAMDRPVDLGLEVGGMKKHNPAPRALLRIQAWGEPPQELMEGVDSVVFDGDQLWAYARDLYPADEQREVHMGFLQLLRQTLYRLSWEGDILEQRDVSDARVGNAELMFGEPGSESLLLFVGGAALGTDHDVVTLDR
jgi:hypothetical protein